MANIRRIERIDESTAAALEAAEINTVDKLLAAAATSAGRARLRQITGTDERQLDDWLIRANLFRLKGVSSGYAELMIAGGITSIEQLAAREGRPLHRELAVVNREHRLVRQLPPVSHVERWVRDAAELAATQ